MISVCMATYNGENFISEQLASILVQLSDEDEIIISDDNSTDKTIEIIEKIGDKRIKLFHSKHSNVVKNIENALFEAKGELIFLSDQDDVWLPSKIQITKGVLERFDLVISDCFITDENLEIIHESFFTINNTKKNKYRALMRNSYLGCCMAFNRSVLSDIIPFPQDIPMHDIWIGNVAAFRHKVCFIDNKLIYYRRHGNNVSSTSDPSKYSIFKQISFRIKIISELIKHYIIKLY